jgi:hypothetical protein
MFGRRPIFCEIPRGYFANLSPPLKPGHYAFFRDRFLRHEKSFTKSGIAGLADLRGPSNQPLTARNENFNQLSIGYSNIAVSSE